YVCSRRQQGSAPTIYSLLPQKYQHLKPVGRLDKDSSGLIPLTNDGQTAHQLMHPSFHKIKRYEVTLDKPLAPKDEQHIAQGVTLPDGPSKLQLKQLDNRTHWQVTMHEGRNRQIRRTFGAIGYSVTTLHRVEFSKLNLTMIGGNLYRVVSRLS